jgi:WD40 repeat protein
MELLHESVRIHRGPVTTAMPVPHSSLIVTAGYDGAVGLFSRHGIELLGYHDHLVNRVVTDPTGTWAGSCSSDYTIKIWNIPERRLVQTLRGHSDDVEDFVFIDHELAVSASRDRRLLMWHWPSGHIERILLGHDRDVLAVAADNQHIYSTGDDRTLRVWDRNTGTLLTQWGPFEAETDTCALDVPRNRIVLGCDDGYIRIFSLNTGASLASWSAHQSGIKRVAVNSDGRLLSAGYDQRVIIWNMDSQVPQVILDPHSACWERSLNWTFDGSGVVAGTFDGTVVQWDAQSGAQIVELGAHPAGPDHICWNEAAAAEDGTIALVSDDGRVRAGHIDMDPASWLTMEPPSGRVLMNAVAYDPHHARILAGAHNHVLHQLRVSVTGLRFETSYALGLGPINTIRFTSHGEGAWIGTYSGTLVHWSPDTLAVIGAYALHDGAIKALRLLADRHEGVSCSAAGEVLAWDWSGHRVRHFGGHTAIVNDLDVSSDGRWLVTIGRDFILRLYEYQTGRLMTAVDLGRRSPKSVLLINEHEALVGDYWGYLLHVNLDSGQIASQRIATNGLSSLSLVQTRVLATSYDGSLVVTDTAGLSVRSLVPSGQRFAAPAAKEVS